MLHLEVVVVSVPVDGLEAAHGEEKAREGVEQVVVQVQLLQFGAE